MRSAAIGVIVLALAVPANAQDCVDVPGNKLPASCGFESAGDVSAWTVGFADSFAFAAGQGETGGAGLADAQAILGPGWVALVYSPCVVASPGEEVRGGFSARSAGGFLARCFPETHEFTDNACTNYYTGSPMGVGGTLTNAYQRFEGVEQLDSQTHSFQLALHCTATSLGDDFQVFFDNAFVVDRSVVEVPTAGSAALAGLAAALVIAGFILLRTGR
jgi:hypothetical protein